MVLKLLVFALFVGYACAATWRADLPIKPQEFADKEGCYVKEINNVIPFGETITPIGYCYRINCGTTLLNYASCGVIVTHDPKCHITEKDLSKPHPLCCPTVKCESENDIEKD